MSYLFALFSGIIQGLTEFLPVSSSGHLCIFQNIFGLENVDTDYFTFSVMLHLATLVAVFIVYHKDIWTLIKSFFSLCGKLFTGKIKNGLNDGERFVIFVVIATLPLVTMLFLADYVEVLYSSVRLVGVILIFNAVMLFISDYLGRKNTKAVADMKPHNALVIGLIQLLAVLPGLSRSGSTITGGLTQGLNRENAVRFSFIMSIPAILGANILEIPDIIANPVPSADILPIALGMFAALVSGIAAMKLLQYIARKSSFKPFAIYCAALGTLAAVLG